jgi:dolichol-phosphate mannosyltransferase
VESAATAGVTKYAVSVVLPTFNERENVARAVEAVEREVEPAEILVVDDDSPDRTWELVEALAAEKPRLRLIRRMRERGLTGAIQCGVDGSTADVVVWMDSDLSMPAATIPRLLQAIEQGADVAIGSRYAPGGADARGNPRSRAFSALINRSARLVLRGPVRDYTTGFVAARRPVLEMIRLRGDYGEYCIDFLTRAGRAGFRIVEIGYVCKDREFGESKTASTFVGFIRCGRKYVTTILRLAVVRRA